MTSDTQSDAPTRPRIVPFWLKFRIVIGSDMQITASIMIIIFFAAFLTCARGLTIPKNMVRVFVMHGKTSETTGHVIELYPAYNDEWGRLTVAYTVNGREYQQRCDFTHNPYLGNVVTVEYAVNHPACARISGLEELPDIFWFVNPFVIVIIAFFFHFIFAFRKRARAIRLLAWGKLTTGINTDSKIIYDCPEHGRSYPSIHCYTFEFKADDDCRYPVKAKLYHGYQKPLEDERKEPLVYDPANPKMACMLDSIPGCPRIDENGTVIYDHAPAMLLYVLAVIPVAWPLAVCIKQAIDALAV